MTIRAVLEHRAGLKSWIPFYKETIEDEQVYDSIYASKPTDVHTIYVGNGLYILNTYKQVIMERIYESEMGTKGKYKYSDLGMILMKELIENVVGTDFSDFVNGAFYDPMGIDRLTFYHKDNI